MHITIAEVDSWWHRRYCDIIMNMEPSTGGGVESSASNRPSFAFRV